VSLYEDLLKAKVDRQEANHCSRTRTWKVIQKLTLLRDEMARPGRDGRYPYVAFPNVAAESDPWDVAHTLASPQEFTDAVCRTSSDRPILVKFGNTTRTRRLRPRAPAPASDQVAAALDQMAGRSIAA
jgi:hypothetical protein